MSMSLRMEGMSVLKQLARTSLASWLSMSKEAELSLASCNMVDALWLRRGLARLTLSSVELEGDASKSAG
jgi:hypothetical protein